LQGNGEVVDRLRWEEDVYRLLLEDGVGFRVVDFDDVNLGTVACPHGEGK
jgi:hypothetical protein